MARPVKSQIQVGQRFASLVVLRKSENGWLCRCDCGSRIAVSTGDLNGSNVRSCGCKSNAGRAKALIGAMIGKKFGHLTVRKRLAGPYWECVCSCGKVTRVKTCNLKSGASRSCSCKKSTPKPRDRKSYLKIQEKPVDLDDMPLLQQFLCHSWMRSNAPRLLKNRRR